MTETIQPYPGMGATLVLPGDRYPMVIVSVSKSGSAIRMADLIEVSKATGHDPDSFKGPFPVWDHTYTADEIKTLRVADSKIYVAKLHKNGKYYFNGVVPVLIGTARYRRDYSD